MNVKLIAVRQCYLMYFEDLITDSKDEERNIINSL